MVSALELGRRDVAAGRMNASVHRWPGVLVAGAYASAVVRDLDVHDNRYWEIAAE
jgi:hypothetical protein